MTGSPGRPGQGDRDRADRSVDDVRTGQRSLGSAWGWLVPVAAALALASIYLWPWLRDPGSPPFGFDTAGYVWRANAVWEGGLDALPTFGERPGHPVLAGVLRDVTRATPIDLARTWPATIAVAIGAAAAALAWAVGARPSLVALAAAIGIAGSGFVAATAVGYAANLLVDALLVAGVALALAMRRTGAGVVLLTLLVAGAAVTHWMFALLLVGLLAIVAATAVIDRRGDDAAVGRSWTELPAAVAIAVVLGAGALLLAPELPSHGVQQEFQQGVDRRIERRMPPFRLEATLPLAAAGAVILGVLGDRGRRRSLPVLLAWAAVAPAGLVAWYALGVDDLPPYRSAGAALGIPALIVLGAGAPAAWARSRGRPGLAIGLSVAALGAAAWLAGVGATTWWRTEPVVARDDLSQTLALDAYLATLPTGTTVVVPVGGDRDPPQLLLKMGMRASGVAAVELRRADLSGGTAAFVHDVIRPDPDGTVVVLLSAYHRHTGGGVALAPGVLLLHGPAPGRPLSVASSDTTAGELVRITAVSLAVLVVVGLGWSLAFARTGIAVVASLAPAVGAAVLILAGLVAARLGVRSAGGGGVAIATAAAAAGWIAWAAGTIRRRRSSVVAA